MFLLIKRRIAHEEKIYVGNISFKATEDNIRELFSQVGEVESVKMITDAQTGQPKSFGFIEMSSEEDAKKDEKDQVGPYNSFNFSAWW